MASKVVASVKKQGVEGKVLGLFFFVYQAGPSCNK